MHIHSIDESCELTLFSQILVLAMKILYFSINKKERREKLEFLLRRTGHGKHPIFIKGCLANEILIQT